MSSAYGTHDDGRTESSPVVGGLYSWMGCVFGDVIFSNSNVAEDFLRD